VGREQVLLEERGEVKLVLGVDEIERDGAEVLACESQALQIPLFVSRQRNPHHQR
jgi:hypothetical protein